MPRCNECGNTKVFDHWVEGEERRYYNETGELLTTDDRGLETKRLSCGDCGSEDVEVF